MADTTTMYEVPGDRLRELADAERERDKLSERVADLESALQPFALAGEERVRRPINVPVLPAWAWDAAARAYREHER